MSIGRSLGTKRAGVVLAVLSLLVAGWVWAEPETSSTAPETTTAGSSQPTAPTKDQEAKPPKGGETEVLVTAPRLEIPLAENPAATTVVGQAELDAMPRAVAVDEALKLVPGVKVDNQHNGEKVHLSIRGQGLLTERGIRGVKVLLDGLPLNDPTGFAPDLYDVDWSTVARVEVLRGPASALYGSGASGGILNIETRDETAPGAQVDGEVSFGSYGFGKVLAEAGGTTGGLGYQVSASRSWDDGWRVHTAFDATNLYSKLHLYNGPSGRVTAIVAGTSYFEENPEGLNIAQVELDPRLPNPDALTYNEHYLTRRGTTGVVSEWNLTDDQMLTVTGYFRHTQWREAMVSTVQHRTYDSPGGLLQYTLKGKLGGLAHTFSAGVDLDWQEIDEYKRPNIGGAHEGPQVVSDQNIKQRGWGLWALERLELGKDWNLVFGARRDDMDNTLDDNLRVGGVDLSGDASFAKTTGRVGATWNPDPAFGVYASWGTGFLPPATEELANNPVAQGGFNQGLNPATSSGEELGVRGSVSTVVSYDVTVFHLSTTDDFGRYRITGRPLETFYRNAGNSTRYGVETMLGWFPVDNLAVRLAYTYSNFTYDRVEIADLAYTDTKMPNAPDHQAYLDVAWQPATGLEAGASVEAVSDWYVDGDNAVSVDGFTLLNARLGYRFHLGGGSARVMLSGRNLTDEEYIAFTEPDPDGNSYQPGPGREGFVGVGFTF